MNGHSASVEAGLVKQLARLSDFLSVGLDAVNAQVSPLCQFVSEMSVFASGDQAETSRDAGFLDDLLSGIADLFCGVVAVVRVRVFLRLGK